MADFIDIPIARLAEDVLEALLEEFATRDGTDYGREETELPCRVAQLRKQLHSGDLQLLFDSSSETWDLLPRDSAQKLLNTEST